MIEYRKIVVEHWLGEFKIVRDTWPDSLFDNRFDNEMHLLNYMGKSDWELIETQSLGTVYIFKRKL